MGEDRPLSLAADGTIALPPHAAATVAPVLQVDDLSVHFNVGHGRPPVRAVDGVSFSIGPGETVGLVGESGSGKTTIGRAILGLTAATSGSIRFQDRDITALNHRERRTLAADLQAVFQDPYSSLNPTRRIGQTLAEAVRTQHLPKGQVRERVAELLNTVGLGADVADRFPTQFSGGQRQRVAIARALMADPRLVICDEPVSALDLSVQAQILNLLRRLQATRGLAYLFVAHDLAVVRHLSQRIIVLYRGRIMEEGDADSIYSRPVHPYTRALLAAVPAPDPAEQLRRRESRINLSSRRNPPSLFAGGCPFEPRCPYATAICGEVRPPMESTPEGSRVACHHWPRVGSSPRPA